MIAHQLLYVPPSQVNEWFLLLGGSLIGVPGVAEVIARRAGTDGRDSPSPQAASSAPPSSSLNGSPANPQTPSTT